MGRFERIEAWSDYNEDHAKLDWKDSSEVAGVAIRQKEKVERRIILANHMRGLPEQEPLSKDAAKRAFNSLWDLCCAYVRFGHKAKIEELQTKPWEEIIDVPATGIVKSYSADWFEDQYRQTRYSLNTLCIATLELNNFEHILKPEASVHNGCAALLKKECDLWAAAMLGAKE